MTEIGAVGSGLHHGSFTPKVSQVYNGLYYILYQFFTNCPRFFPYFSQYVSHFVSKVATEQQERDQAVGREVILEQELRAERRRRIDMEAQVTLADSWKAVSNGEVMIDGFLYGLMMMVSCDIF